MNKFNEYNSLNTINQWINNCDTKVSIFLGVYGIFATTVVSSDLGNWMASIIKKNVNSMTVCGLVYLLLLLIGIVLVCIGMYKFISTLIPTINLKHKSIMFFGNVASYKSFESYCDAVKEETEATIKEDLLHQIYASSVICYRKFQNQKKGIILSSVGISLIISWLIISFFVYYI